jgi:beta-lactam-binding protein with PASTA domain
MARLFDIKPPEGMSNVKLDSQGRATVQFTVTNVSAREIDGRAILVSLPQTKPPSGPVEKGWVTIDGNKDRHFGVTKDVTTTFTVKISVPPKSPAGTYAFRLDTVWVNETDQGDTSVAIAFTVAAPVPTTGPAAWLIAVIALVLIAVGVGAWLVLKGGGPKVPDLTGKTVSDADAELKADGFTLDSNSVQTVDSKPDDSGKIVSQLPLPGQKASKGQAVQVKVGSQMVEVPLLVGHSFQEAQGMLSQIGLTVGQSTTAANSNYAGGVVFAQKPDFKTPLRTGSPVDVQVTPQMVSVQPVVGQTLGNAIISLQRIGLKVTEFEGDTTKTVTFQVPVANASVPVGSSVKLIFPATASCAFQNCRYFGFTASQMVLEQGMATRKALGMAPAPK